MTAFRRQQEYQKLDSSRLNDHSFTTCVSVYIHSCGKKLLIKNGKNGYRKAFQMPRGRKKGSPFSEALFHFAQIAGVAPQPLICRAPAHLKELSGSEG